MRVTAVVVTHDSASDVIGCLTALDAQDHDALEVEVVDNASRDGTVALVVEALARPRRHPTRLVVEGTNRGLAGAVNDALARSTAEAVLLVNPDARLDPDALRRMVAVLDRHPRCGTVQPRLLRPGRTHLDTTGHVLTTALVVVNRDAGSPAATQRPGGPVFGASGAAVLHRRSMLDDVAWRGPGGHREHLTEDLVAYFEDVELDLRARVRGWEARYAPDAVGEHARGGSRRWRSTQVEALSWANRLLVLGPLAATRTTLRHVPLALVTVALSTGELALTRPLSLARGIARLRLLPGFVRRAGQLRARALVPPARVVRDWQEPFDARAWVTQWWRRVGPRPGADASGAPSRPATRA